MPAPTGIESTLLDGLEASASKLQNGNAGNIDAMSHVLADLAKVVAAMARTGGPTWAECEKFRESIKRSFIDWKAALVICGTIFGIVWKILG